ncbi:MAG: formylglycine-generating enzyme family protein [Parvibaculum sp.]|uniref:formylglycine-generating enzyme family protein n=1 Tax=Parvibaculum sp. TaxID=2024848 RepID=UPI003C70C292
MTRPRLIIAAVAAVAVAAALGAIWGAGGREAARLAEAAPRACLDLSTDRSGSHPGMVWVPGGSFEMGDNVYPEEGPARRAEVAGFWMDRHEVTNAEFAAFVAATGYVTVAERPVDPAKHPGLPPEMREPGAVVFIMPNDIDGRGDISQWWRYVPGANWRHPAGPGSSIESYENFPVVALAYDDIEAYARWKGRSIPTEAQWEWAARGGRSGTPDHEQPKQANTWQGLFPVINTADDGFVGLAPAGCFEPNAYGLHDMIGNVWEWTSDPYRENHANGKADASRRVIKGGSYLCAPNYCMRYRSGSRQGQEADLATSHLGFRTVLAAPGP